MGIFSVLPMTIMCIYHKLTARPHGKVIAPFRFLSFLRLTVPTPVYGVGLAMIPVMLVNIFITFLF